MKRLTALVICLAAFSGCYKKEMEAAQAEKAQLAAENTQLKAEVQKLKETAQYHFQQGQDFLSGDNFDSAIASFRLVTDKYPNDPLVAAANKSIAAATQKKAAAAEQKRREEAAAARAREKEMAESGEPVDYGRFYAKSRTGLTVGKRYGFHACLSTTPCLQESQYGTGQVICSLNMDFDNQAEYERWLESGQKHCGTIVASMNWGGSITVHRLH